MKYQQQDNKEATTDTVMSKNKGTTPTPQGDSKKANSRNDNEPGQGMTQTNTTTTRMTTKDDNKDHDMTKIQTTKSTRTQPRMTRRHVPYSHTHHNDKITHTKEDAYTQNKITHTNTHTRIKM